MLNVALVGAGRIGKVHAAIVARHPTASLHSVVDVCEQAARTLAAAHGARTCTISEALSDPNVDAVLIASATDTHADLIERAAEAGKKIFCEKPIDLQIDRVRACLATVSAQGATLMVGFNRRFDRHIRGLRAAFKAGEVGKAETLLIISRDPAPPPLAYVQASGGLFRDMTIHDIDTARWILGEEPRALQAIGRSCVDHNFRLAGDIDTALLTLEFPSGAVATIANSRRSGYGYDQRIELHGADGLLQVGNVLESTVVRTGAAGSHSAKPVHFFLERYAEAYAAQWDYFVGVCEGKNEPSPGGLDGERALAIANAANDAMETGHRVPLAW